LRQVECCRQRVLLLPARNAIRVCWLAWIEKFAEKVPDRLSYQAADVEATKKRCRDQ